MGQMSQHVDSTKACGATHKLTSSRLTRMVLLWLVTTVLILLPCVTSTPVSAHAALAPASAPELYFGLTYPGTPDIPTLSTYETQIGKGVSLVSWYQPWEFGNQLQPFPDAQMVAARDHGAIPVLSWEPIEFSPWQLNEPAFSLASIAGGAWDSYIRQYALAAKAWGHPFFLRFAFEMNGNWEPWSEFNSGNKAGQFVEAWRHVHDIFTSVGATNVTWVWCPNTESSGTTPLADLYPGNAYVDWVGMDGYNFGPGLYNGPWLTFSQVFSATYTDLLKLTSSTKPIMIGETGSVNDGGSEAAWITDALTTQLPKNFSRIKALIWFDETAGTNIDVSINTSPQSLAAFQQAIAANTYQSNIYRTLDQSPIPAPEQVVLPPPPKPPAVPAPPVSVSYLSGPSPGTIQLINAQRNQPVPQATLLYQNGTSSKTNSSGVTRIPLQDKARPVLTQIAAGTVVIHIHLVLDPNRGYQIEINLATGRVTRILVHVIVDLRPLVAEFALLLPLVIIVLSLFLRSLGRRRQRRRRRRSAKQVRDQPVLVRYR